MKARNSKWFIVRNPMWLSDVFVCAKIKDYDKYCYVKLNCFNKIEEIGIDAEERLHGAKIEELSNLYEPITQTHKMRFNSIGDDYWWVLINRERRRNR